MIDVVSAKRQRFAGRDVMPGDPLPEAATHSNLMGLLEGGRVRLVPRGRGEAGKNPERAPLKKKRGRPRRSQ